MPVSVALSHLFMLVRDLAAARRFWVEDIGLRVLQEEHGYLQVGGVDGFPIGMEQGEPGPANATEICVRVADVDEACRRLVERGVAVAGPPADQEWGARHAWLTDPDGRRMSIFS